MQSAGTKPESRNRNIAQAILLLEESLAILDEIEFWTAAVGVSAVLDEVRGDAEISKMEQKSCKPNA